MLVPCTSSILTDQWKKLEHIRSGADSLEGLGMRRLEQTLENDEMPHAGSIFKALLPFCETQDIGRCARP